MWRNGVCVLTSKTENAILYSTAIYAIADSERVIHFVKILRKGCANAMFHSQVIHTFVLQ
jgi:hypothetical protein